MEEENPINLTPLIDVVFVVLIMFILIAPMIDVDKVELAQSKKSEKIAYEELEAPLQIHLYKDGKITINQAPVSATELAQKCRLLKTQHPEVIPLVFCDKLAPFGLYQTVKNDLEEAGFAQLQVVLKSP